jgi:hypothetical protein
LKTDPWLWIRRLAVTAAALTTLPFLVLPEVPPTELPLLLDWLSRAWAPLALLAITCFTALALVLAWSKGEGGGRDVAVFLACTALTMGILLHQMSEDPTVLATMLEDPTLLGGLSLVSWTMACAAMMRFSVTFPREATLEDMHRAFWFGKKPPADRPPAFTRGVWWLFRFAWPVGGSVSAVLILAWAIGGENLMGIALTFMWFFTNLPLMAALLLLPRIHRKGDEKTRRQMQWVVLGVTWGLIILPIVAIYGTLLPWMVFPGSGTQAWMDAGGLTGTGLALGGIIFALCLAVALFKDGLFDPRFVLGRSVVYGGLGLLLLFLFAVLEEVLQSVVLERLSEGSGLSGWIAGAAAALAFGPLRARMERFMNSWLGDAPGAAGS